MNTPVEPSTTKRRRQTKGTHKFHVNLTAAQEQMLIDMADQSGESFSLIVGKLVEAEHKRRTEVASTST